MNHSKEVEKILRVLLSTGLVLTGGLAVDELINTSKMEAERHEIKSNKVACVEKISSSDEFKAFCDGKCDAAYEALMAGRISKERFNAVFSEYHTKTEKFFESPNDGNLQIGEQAKVEEYLQANADDPTSNEDLKHIETLQVEEYAKQEEILKGSCVMAGSLLASAGCAVGLGYTAINKHRDTSDAEQEDPSAEPNQ